MMENASPRLVQTDPLALDEPIAIAAEKIREGWSNRERWMRGSWYHFQAREVPIFGPAVSVAELKRSKHRLKCRRLRGLRPAVR
jgi:hypothetical protein